MLTNVINHNFPIHREQIGDVEDRESIVIQYDYEENMDGDCDSTEVNSKLNDGDFEDFKRIGMNRIGEGSNEYEIMMKSFLRAMGIYAKDSDILAVHKNSVVDPVMKARKNAFEISAQAIAEKCGGDPNIWLAWYAGSTEEICRIISYGFSCCDETVKGVSHGIGIHLSPAKFPLDSFSSVNSTILQSNGVSHLLLCRVIMGKMEPIPVGSKQIQPSSREYDSGVDNVTAPRRLTVWSAFMNSHIFPTHVISFRPPSFNRRNQLIGLSGRNQVPNLKPSTPWMTFPGLIGILSKCLDPFRTALIVKAYDEFRKHKISRQQMVQTLRQMSGDRLLTEIIKSRRQKRQGHPE